jgi:chromosome segregation protein
VYLKRIEIQGFKSFADPVTIEFKDGVTCIVGPNGSGKSNISDAMRWVLGEQSAKTLRGGKMEEIIFAGTDSRRAKGMAEVTLVFDNSSGVLDIDYTEVALKRRLFRSGESEYYINGNQCRLRDIRELIMDTGIGVDGYSFIGQGRVDKIVSDKPETRREVFEEAAGIIKYKSKRAEAERKLEGAGANLDRLGDLIFDIESRIDSLRDESEKAKEHAGLSKRYRELEINVTLKNIENLQGKNKELAAQFEEAGARLEALRGEKAEADAKLGALRDRDTELEQRATELRERISGNRTRSMAIANTAAITEERQKSIEKDRLRLEEDIRALAERADERALALADFEAKHADLAKTLDRFAGELATLLAEAAAKESAYSTKSLRVDELKSELFELSRERSAREAELASSEGLAANFDDTEASIKSELAQGGDEHIALAGRARALTQATETQAAEKAGLEKKGATLREKYSAGEQGFADTRLRLEAIRLEAEKKLSRQKTIEEMESNYEGYASGVRALMQAKRPGVIGVVTELMKAEPGFEAAIETALGAATQNIVTETEQDAKGAIEYLKANKAGRLTFLPARSIRARAFDFDAEMEKIKGFAGYATDRISFDKKYEEVFLYLLGRTLIAETLDDAIAISAKNKKGWLIVTKDGEIINPAGALTGGAYKNKTANLLERKNEIDALKKDIESLGKKGDEARAAAEALVRENETLLAQIRENDAAGREKETALIRSQEELKSAGYMLAELDKRLEKRRAELGVALKDRENSGEMIARLRETIEKLAVRIETVSGGIGREMDGIAPAKQESDLAQAAATELRLKAAEAGRDKENADQTLRAMKNDIAETSAQLEARRKERVALDGFSPGLSDEAAAAELAALTEARAALDDELSSVVSERASVHSQIEEKEMAFDRSLDRIEAQISSRNGMEVELGRQETRLTTWKEKLFDEFELSYVHALEYKNDDFVMSTGIKENREVKERLKEIGDVNPGSIKEYEETSERYTFLTTQRDDVVASMKDFQDIVRDMDKISKEKFSETFEKVSETFGETFALLFGGGKGQILLEDENDPLECGIDIKISPPGKTNLASIDSYSGGEKSMIAIALLFSILKAKPTPFCILDEIDAALDETNIHRFANYVANFGATQFALVTHQRSTMEYADALFGVTMQEQGVTSVLSLLLGEKETEAFAETLN